jgi:hypothetical protein
VRDRAHRFPGRRNALKVLYDDIEVASVRAAAQLAGLDANWVRRGSRPDSVRVRGRPGDVGGPGAAGRAAAGPDGAGPVRSLNQAVAALNSGVGAPVWLLQAVSGCARASERMDRATVVLSRRLG